MLPVRYAFSMNATEVKVTFQPSGRSVYVLPGTQLLEAAGRAGIILKTPCGGQGTCGKCLVRVADGGCSAEWIADGPLTREAFDEGFRLACQCTVDAELVVEIPEASRFESRQQILVDDSGEQGELNAVVRKVAFHLDAPCSGDPRSDSARLRDAIGAVAIPDDLLRELPGFLRTQEWQGTAVLADSRLIGLEAGDTTKTALGVAFDVGTTTLVGTIFDLTTGRELGVASAMNSQIALGDDVISRIQQIRENPDALGKLQESVLADLNEQIGELAQAAGETTSSVYEVVLAGNATMQQILCGYDPSALGELPFVQVFDEARVLAAADLGLEVNARADVFVFPQVGGFVGGDTVAGMLAARLDQWEKPVLMVDIGTNGEIILACGDKLEAASTAAGPAFEGARIRQGMRAATGAIEKVIINEDVSWNVIGNAKPAGLCGTALIDTVAGLLRIGVLDETGRIMEKDEVQGELSPAILERLIADDGDTRFLLVPPGESASGEAIYLWQRDVREVQLATGAIRAGISILLRRAGLEPEDLGGVLLAGAFGNFIRRSNAMRIGLLPPIAGARIRYVGNAASLGAKLALLSGDEREYAETLRRKTQHVDLSMDPAFQEEFGAAMLFPEESQ